MATNAAARWRKLVRARRDEMESLRPGGGAVGGAFWDRRARRYAAEVMGRVGDDPFLNRVVSSLNPGARVLDVGAGPGRLALPLAPFAREVVAVDPSSAMLSILRREARRAGLRNIRLVPGRWEEVDEAGDVVVCAYVLPMIEDAARFVRKLDAAAGREVFVLLSAVGNDALLDPFWRRFHRRPRRPGPSFLDAADVIREQGIDVKVELAEAPTLTRYPTVARAVAAFADQLLIADTPEIRAELRKLVSAWLVPADEGGFRPPLRTVPVAILRWDGGGSGRRSR